VARAVRSDAVSSNTLTTQEKLCCLGQQKWLGRESVGADLIGFEGEMAEYLDWLTGVTLLTSGSQEAL